MNTLYYIFSLKIFFTYFFPKFLPVYNSKQPEKGELKLYWNNIREVIVKWVLISLIFIVVIDWVTVKSSPTKENKFFQILSSRVLVCNAVVTLFRFTSDGLDQLQCHAKCTVRSSWLNDMSWVSVWNTQCYWPRGRWITSWSRSLPPCF